MWITTYNGKNLSFALFFLILGEAPLQDICYFFLFSAILWDFIILPKKNPSTLFLLEKSSDLFLHKKMCLSYIHLAKNQVSTISQIIKWVVSHTFFLNLNNNSCRYMLLFPDQGNDSQDEESKEVQWHPSVTISTKTVLCSLRSCMRGSVFQYKMVRSSSLIGS